jgi:uncharacterized Zn finger protein
MSRHFGKTWWGEQWLQSLTNIDYDNRLPRGSAYARNGAVTSIKIDENSWQPPKALWCYRNHSAFF